MLHPFDYPYERATVLDRPRPYDLSPYLGPGFLNSFWRSRRAFREQLVGEVGRFGAGPSARACQSWLDSLRTQLGGEARAPEREVPLRSLAAARSQWQRSVESGACNTTDLLG